MTGSNIVIKTGVLTSAGKVTRAGIVNRVVLSFFGSIYCLLLQGQNVQDDNASGFYKLM